TCGFRYFVGHGLDLDVPESIDPVPNRAMLGTLIHEVLRETFERLQEHAGEPVVLEPAERPTIESTLLEAAQYVIETPTRVSLAEFDWGTTTAFARQQLEELFTGVGTAAENPYYRSNYPHNGGDRGLFARFLDTEMKNGSAPSHFEYPFGGVEDTSAETDNHVEIDTPRGTVKLRGQIDRIDRTSNDEGPDEVTVWDYKSGSAPSTARTIDGTDFQLATYLRAAVTSLDGDVRVMDGHYYEVSPPRSVNPKDGLSGDFDSEAAFDAFLDAEYPARLAQLQTALERGAFQPTYLDEKDAGCEYCAYRSACDVRHHQRHERLDALDDNHVEYVPPGVADGGPFSYAPDAAPTEPEDGQ
ncbi:MAG TPA: PD-(D/E)XK nuclease family protein, partial [Halococcus sp.]|nr:PD-(D/E)XK nuclease family protein [Halococcus sp.]